MYSGATGAAIVTGLLHCSVCGYRCW